MPISSARWADYPWKNELETQRERVLLHISELLDEECEVEHDPHAMLERALVLAAFSIRRMIEKRLVTDAFASRTFAVRTYQAVEDFRGPYFGASGGSTYRNYNFTRSGAHNMKAGDLVNEIIHSSQLMVIGGDTSVKDGLLMACPLNSDPY